MKKTASLLLAGVLATSMLVGCGSNDADTTPAPAETATPAPQVEVDDIITPFADLEMALQMPGMMPGSDVELDALYGLDPALFESYVIKVPMMNVTATEYAVFELKSADDMDTLTTAIEARVETLAASWETYLPDQYALVKDYLLLTQDNYVLFSIGENNDYFENTFLRLFDDSIEALELPININQVSGVVVEEVEGGYVFDVEFMGESYTVTGIVNEMTFIDGDAPVVGDLVDVSFENPIDGNSDDLTGNLTFIGYTPGAGTDGDAGADLGVAPMN